MKKGKIAFVVQRYGREVNGGSEYACRELAEHLSELYDVDVFTTCARGFSPWDNYYDAGVSKINGVQVYRFPVERVADIERIREARNRADSGSLNGEIEWIKEMGPFCPQLIAYIQKTAHLYKSVLFQTYNFYTTVMGLRLGLRNSVIIPTAHDEPNLYKKIYEETLYRAKGVLYNSIEEREFLTEKFGIGDKPSCTTCVGIKEPDMSDWTLPKQYKKYENYILYAGRVANGKNFRQLNQYFIRYKQTHNSDIKLLVVGRINNYMQLTNFEDIVYLGFVSEENKFRLMRSAKFLVMPSLYESLSLVILESMQVGRPVLVNGDCPVLKNQCIRSNAGLYYTNYAEFEKCMDFMLSNEAYCREMGKSGKEFVKNNYAWEKVIRQVGRLIEEIATEGHENEYCI